MDVQNNLDMIISDFYKATASCKSDPTLLDSTLRNLITYAVKYKKETLISLFEKFNDIPLNFENKVDGVTLLEFFQQIVDNILLVKVLSPVDYKLLIKITNFYPTIIEKKIDSILRKVYLQEPTIEYNDLFICLLVANILLRQEHKLISQLITTLEEVITNENEFKEFDLTTRSSFFPLEFKNKFTESISSYTNSHVLMILKTLIDNLNRHCVKSLKSDTTDGSTILFKATAELLIGFLNGVSIVGYTSTLSYQQEFINILNKLGKNLSRLIKKSLHVNHNANIIAVLLSVILSWSEIQNMIKYYLPNVNNDELVFPISDDHWQQLIQRITNFGEEECINNMNKLMIHNIKYYSTNDSTIKLNNLIDGLKYCWSIILKCNTEIISLLNNKELSELVLLLLKDMMSNEYKFNQWMEIISNDNLQENKRFIIYLLCHILMQIGTIPKEGITNTISQHINAKVVLSSEVSEKNKIIKILETMKTEILDSKWEQIKNTEFDKIKLYLDIIINMPIEFLNSNVKALIFMVVFSINKECMESEVITTLCNKIFLKLFQMPGVDILNYIDPVSVIHQLNQSTAFPKALEKSLRNIKSYDDLKILINASYINKGSMYILLKCIDNAKQKLDADQKCFFKKAIKKLSKKIFNRLPNNIELPYDVQCLTLIIKMNTLNKEIMNIFKESMELTLHNIFMSTEKQHSNELLEAGLQLAATIFRNYQEFKIPQEILTKIWPIILERPCENLLLPLIASTEIEQLKKMLILMQTLMIEELPKSNGNKLENTFIVLNAILKSHMAIERNNLRTAIIESLFKNIQVLNVSEQYWPKLLELLQNIIISKNVYMSDIIIDLSMNIALQALEKRTLTICNHVLMLCGTLIKVKMDLVVNRLPVLLILFRRLIIIIIQLSKTVDKVEEHICQCLLFDIEKFVISLIKHKKDLKRLSPYISLQNIMASLFSICDQYGIALLSRALPANLQEIFKTQLDDYNKFYKFFWKDIK
ncbi:hypothetical protein M0802_008636 [Mischocyttarus mexicanus]|nr:hypothetical protein M0802_008636 [Mischocyttarus mexicanus]